MSSTFKKTKDWGFIIGVLLLCIGLQFTGYGIAVCIPGDLAKMNASEYYPLVSTIGSMGVVLVLPVVGKLTAMWGQRNMIQYGILIQLIARLFMISSTNWIVYMLSFFLQQAGGGLYISAAYVIILVAVAPEERTEFFGYIAIANAVGAILGPIIVSSMYAAPGIISKLAYLVNFPLSFLGFVLVYRSCPNNKVHESANRFDFTGLFLAVIGITSFVLWLNLSGKVFSWFSIMSARLLAVAVISLTMMIRRELTVSNPAIPIRMFKNKRLTYSFIGAMVAAAYASCSAAYCVMWIRINYNNYELGNLFTGTATLTQQLVVLILGFFLGSYVGRNFTARFRPFAILSMVAAVVATGLLYCLKFTSTAAESNLLVIGKQIPVGMVIIYCATAIGGFTSIVAQSTFSAFWQSNTPKEDIPSGQALYTLGGTGGAVIFGAIAGVVLGTSNDYSRVFAAGFLFAIIGLICAFVGFRFTDEEKTL